MEERVVELETKVAFQDLALAELSEALARQQRQMDALEKAVRQLVLQIQALQPTLLARESEETPPPHY